MVKANGSQLATFISIAQVNWWNEQKQNKAVLVETCRVLFLISNPMHQNSKIEEKLCIKFSLQFSQFMRS